MKAEIKPHDGTVHLVLTALDEDEEAQLKLFAKTLMAKVPHVNLVVGIKHDKIVVLGIVLSPDPSPLGAEYAKPAFVGCCGGPGQVLSR